VPIRITLAHLASACGISERALLDQFKRFIGVSPMAHLLRMRLSAVRAGLQQSDGKVVISEAAARCGFTHLGRFATDYRKAFGELPLDTLRRALGSAAQTYDGGRDSVATPFTTRLPPSLMVLPLRTETLEERRIAQELMELVTATLSRTRAATITFADRMVVVHRQVILAPRAQAHAPYILHGRVVGRNDRLRITLWLMDAMGRHVWGDSHDDQTAWTRRRAGRGNAKRCCFVEKGRTMPSNASIAPCSCTFLTYPGTTASWDWARPTVPRSVIQRRLTGCARRSPKIREHICPPSA
jgi:AraC-like DNA-binding protein